MDSSAIGEDLVEEMCKRILGGEEKGKGRQQATSDGSGGVREQDGEK